MKKFSKIFKFELIEMLKSKPYIITTCIFCIIAIVGLGIPLVFPSVVSDMEISTESIHEGEPGEASVIAIVDENRFLSQEAMAVSKTQNNVEWETCTTIEELKEKVNQEKVDAGIVIQDALKFEYYVLNSGMLDTNAYLVQNILETNYKSNIMFNGGLEEAEVVEVLTTGAEFETVSLGSDGEGQYFSTLALMVILYMIVIMYGTIIATSVASEKGNRTMELLVTSANSTALLCGKVFAGCVSAFLQIGLFIGIGCGMYAFTRDAWNGALDMLFNIPVEIIIAFLLFGISGFIFYAFIFGALGALASKSEDVNTSATPITMVLMVVYFIAIIGIMNPENMIYTVASFVPFSSPIAMFSRMSMVQVEWYEVGISFAILVASTAVAIWVGSTIYRRGTLMYGNPVKFKTALKWLKKSNN